MASKKTPPWARDDHDDKSTPTDLAAHVNRVSDALRESGAADLHRLVERFKSRGLDVPGMGYRSRIPFGLIASPDRGRVFIEGGSVQRPTKFTHLVLSPETARAYELTGFFLGVDYQLPDCPARLETFSIEYMRDDVLARCQE